MSYLPGFLANGINYSWGDCYFTIPNVLGGSPIDGIREIEYEEDQEVENNYGAGNYPSGVGFGMVKYKASMTLFKETLVTLQGLAPSGKIQLFPPFQITVTYGNTSQALQTDILKFCTFKNNPFAAKVNDKLFTGKIELNIVDISWNGQG